MSVRRLADNQPESFAFTPENRGVGAEGNRQISAGAAGLRHHRADVAGAEAERLLAAARRRSSIVARMLDMPYIRALEVATFYTMFNLEPVGRHYVQLCGTTPCMLRGAEEIKKVCHDKIGEPGHVSADGKFSWIEVECLGACCNAPMVQINDDYFEDLTPENFAAARRSRGRQAGDRSARRPAASSSEPPGGKLTALTTLLRRGRQGAGESRRGSGCLRTRTASSPTSTASATAR